MAARPGGRRRPRRRRRWPPLLPSAELGRGRAARPRPTSTSHGWPAAGVATLTSGTGSSVGVLVGADLADALAAAPGGGVDLAAAIQPALDAAAARCGSAAGAGRSRHRRGAGRPGRRRHRRRAAARRRRCPPPWCLLTVDRRGPATGPVTGIRSAALPSPAQRGVELLHGVAMEVTVELGRTRMSVRELLALCPGDVLELDRAAGSPADLLVNGRLIARGEVVVVDEDFALRVTEIVAQSARELTVLELVIRVVVSLGVVLGLFWTVTRLGSRKLGGRDRALVRVRSRQALSRGSSLAVVEVGSRVLVVGVSDAGVRLLTELDPFELETDVSDLTELPVTWPPRRRTELDGLSGRCRTAAPPERLPGAGRRAATPGSAPAGAGRRPAPPAGTPPAGTPPPRPPPRSAARCSPPPPGVRPGRPPPGRSDAGPLRDRPRRRARA